MPQSHSLRQQRMEKLERLRRRGVEPYPHRYHRSHQAQAAAELFREWETRGQGEPPQVAVAGRITARRRMGGAIFMDLRDGSGSLQVQLRRDILDTEAYSGLEDLDLGDFLGVWGELFRTKTGEVTVLARGYALLAKALLPLPEKWHGLRDPEARYRQRYLDLIANQEQRQLFVQRSRIIAALRRFLEGQGFLEVETPVLGSQAGGAAARPFVTHHRVLGRDLYLRIATELHLKRLLVAGFDRVYELGRVFRNEGVTARHNPEFTSLEAYEAYADYNDMMRLTEELVAHLAQEALGDTRVSLAGQEIDLAPPWRRLALREALREHHGIDILAHADADSLRRAMAAAGFPTTPELAAKGWGKLVEELVSIIEPKLRGPLFMLDYPVEVSPLAKAKAEEPRLAERFEGFVGGLEVANAFTELNDPLEQRRRLQGQALQRALGDEEAELPDEDFLLALEHGMPPAGGLGIGIDRLVMVLLGQPSIREVILFPQLREKGALP